MKNVLSCVQPTGDIHLGNYFGAVQNWVRIQNEYKCLYGVVDYHSMTMPYDPVLLRENTWKMVLQLLACGIKPENLFIQSLVPEHAELAWILGCTTSYGELTRMTQFKDKTDQLREADKDAFVSVGLFAYPVLQAADILIYHADFVPVGKDQEQHLELSRNIAQRFNHQFGKEYFVHPAPLFTETPKILSPADPSRKMSKSLGEKHYINLFGEEGRIRKQIKSAVTDTGEPADGGPATDGAGMSVGVKNLFELLRACGDMAAHDALMANYQSGARQYGDLKEAVANAVVKIVNPFREQLAELQADKKNVESQIQEASAETRKRAQQTLREVREIAGLTSLK
ncbi:MAG: tryptophan--tRNA ligase [Saprospiraceae bacterium]